MFNFAGLTGGLAAPLVAGSIGVLIGSGALAGLATTAGAAVLGTTFGVAGAGLAGYKVGAFQFFLNEEKKVESKTIIRSKQRLSQITSRADPYKPKYCHESS